MKKQTRKSISIRGDSYDKLKAYCDKHKITMSHWLEVQAEKALAEKASAKTKPPVEDKKTDNGNKKLAEPYKPFTLAELKKDLPPKAEKKPITGGGTHLL